MGTRADFYVGRGENAEWLGSVAWDGYPTGIAGKKTGTSNGDVLTSPILTAKTEAEYRAAVAEEFGSRDDATTQAEGWPWPWDDSHTTDYSYAFDEGKVHASNWGYAWFDPLKDEPEHDDVKTAVFPNMKERQNVTLGPRSGVMVFGAGK